MRAWIRLPSPAMGVALIALVVALSGTTYAAVRIGTKQIKNNAITSPKIRNGQVRNVDLARNSVVTAKIVAGAVTRPADPGRERRQRRPRQRRRDEREDPRGGGRQQRSGQRRGDGREDPRGNVGESDLATDAVTSAKIKDGSLATADYADGSIAASKIKDGEVVEGNGRMLSTAVTLADGTGRQRY